MEKSRKRVFWQAFIVALIIFSSGIFVGILVENSRINVIEEKIINTETSIFDLQLAISTAEESNLSCERMSRKIIEFADKIYSDSSQLEKFEEANKITGEIKTIHRKYDLLRTILWKNTIDVKEKCPREINSLIYLYQYNDPEIKKKALQTAFSKKLLEIKREHGDSVVLIPIAADNNIETLEILKEKYNIQDYPAIIVDENFIVYEIEEIDEIEKKLFS